METLLASLLSSTINLAVPLLLAALGEVVVERAGIINIGIEGKLLTGAFAAVAATVATGSPLLGVLAGAVSGAAMAGVAAYLIVRCAANQVIVGTALNLLALGATGVAYRSMFGVTGTALTIAGLPALRVPLLVHLPLVGEALFAQNGLGYAAFAAVPLLGWFLFRTLPGLRLRAVGEDPWATEAQGVRVDRVRAAALVFAGTLAGLAGAYLSVGYAHTFVEEMSGGRGFVALAIVVFGRWSPRGVLGGALLFGSATALQFHFQAVGFAVPYQFFLALPYVLTLIVLALYAGGASAPVSLGVPYERDGNG